MLYDVPGRTGTTIALETYEAAAQWDTVVAVKDAVGDFARGIRLQQLGYAVYSGDDIATLGWLAHGGVGVVSVLGHAAGDQIRAMVDAWFAGDPAAALENFTRMLPAIDAVMGVAELRSHHRQGSPRAARRARQPERAQPARSAGRRRGRRAARRPRGVRPHLTTQEHP